MLKWEVTSEGDRCRVRPLWSTTNGALIMTGASIHDVRGLSPFNKRLLKQRGAIGEPEVSLREKSKKLVTAASIETKPEHASNGIVEDSSSVSSVPTEQSEQVEVDNRQSA
jgi:hypothetical protein